MKIVFSIIGVIVGIIVLIFVLNVLTGVFLIIRKRWLRVRYAGQVRKTWEEAPRYMAHLEECGLCFHDGGPYPFEPCPIGKDLMWEEMQENEEVPEG